MTQDQELSEILDNYYAPIVLPDINRSGLKRAIEAYVTTRVKEARKDQVMRDFLKHSLCTEVDESLLIGIRESQIKQIDEEALTTTTNGKGE